ncbi:MAG TPA: hypothetical protein VFB38_13365 [Chthonomonadaceae bacterium]|nr:hypothetical protein [Chthonomonadaceae bacterium]
MKQKACFVAALALVLLAAGYTGAKAQSDPHSIFYASRDVAILRTAAGYPTILKRMDRFYERMVDTLTMYEGTITPRDFYITRLPNGEYDIMCRRRVVMTVTRADARSYHTTPESLARRWMRGFADTIPQVQPLVGPLAARTLR